MSMDNELRISSAAFEDGEVIPAKYTSDGEDINPPITIGGVSAEVAALALIIDDPDAATDPDGPGKTFDHWVLFNISPDMESIEENSVPYGAIVGKNGMGENRYVGPAPPNGEHRYFFKLYALSEPLQLNQEATKSDVEREMEGKILDRTQIIGKYQRKQ